MMELDVIEPPVQPLANLSVDYKLPQGNANDRAHHGVHHRYKVECGPEV